MFLLFNVKRTAIEVNLLKNDFNFFSKLQGNKILHSTYKTLKMLNKLNQFNN
jgi:hypothetical protein